MSAIGICNNDVVALGIDELLPRRAFVPTLLAAIPHDGNCNNADIHIAGKLDLVVVVVADLDMSAKNGRCYENEWHT